MKTTTTRAVTFVLVAAALSWASSASAYSSYFTSNCATSGCHTAANVGSTASTCAGCHSHGTHPDSTKSSINLTGQTDATSYAPGATVSVTINAGYRSGWVRAVLYDQAMNQLAISTGPNGMGGGASFPVTLTAPAPTTPGSYTWRVAWYGNRFDAGGAAFGPGFTADPSNPNHGYEYASTNTFSVSAPAAPTVALQPASLSFGSVNVGASASQSAQIRNTGTAALTVTAVARCTSPATSAEYTVTAPAVPFTVAAGGSAALSVAYAPTAAGTDTGCVAVTSNASNGPTTNLAVSGTGVVPAAPRIAVSPATLSFGNVTVGSTGSQSFTVSNTGTAQLTGTVARASGTSAEYAPSPASFSVAPGASQVVAVAYAPVDVGADAGSLVVASNDAATPTVNVSVSGAGVAAPAPSIALAPATLAFGNVTVGGAAQLPVQVQNSGTAPLSVSAIAPCAGTSAEFGWSPAAPITVAAGGSATVSVTYRPTAAGTDTGCLAFTSNASNAPTANLAVSGTGVAAAAPRIAVSPSALTFGNVTVGSSGSQSFTVSNTGTAQLTGTVARATGTSAEYGFSPASLSVAPGGSQVVTVTYVPTAVGADSGALVVSSNDTATPTANVTVAGSGVAAPAPSIALAPNALAFGNVVAGTPSSLTAQVRNAGTAPLEVTSIAACAGTSAEFGWSPAAPLTVAAGQSATLTVTYRPNDVGADSGCLALASNDAASPTVNLGLSGAGVAQAVPAIALVPGAIDFGTVTVGSTATRTSVVQNTGTGTLSVASITTCSGTPARFTWSPAAPFTVAPGQGVTVSVSYAPTAAATDSGCLAVASDDPAHPTANLAVTGTGALAPVPSVDVDVDIAELEVPSRVGALGDRSIAPRLEVRNRSVVAGSAAATVVGVLDGVEVYRQTISLEIAAGAERELSFPAYQPARQVRGLLIWTATVADQDPDVDQATAQTRLGVGSSSSQDDAARIPWAREFTASSAAVTQATGDTTTQGCSTGGDASLVAVLLAAALFALRRRLNPTLRRG